MVQEFIQHSTAFIERCILSAISSRGHAVIGLSGGSTPGPVYELVGKNASIDWSKVWIFLVDDRYVREDSPHSNQFLIRSTLLRNAPIPESQFITPDTTLPIEECRARYDAELKSLFAKGPADLVILGMGNDGHIASLFPPLSEHAFGPSLAIHTTTDIFDIHDRISVTLPVLTQARQALFLLKGKEKKDVWEQMMKSTEGIARWPAKAVMEAGHATVITL